MTENGSGGERAPLNREAIVAGAMALADEAGIGAITMRKLAAHLGYEVMSLYNHVANKNELLMLLVDAAAAGIERPDPEAEPMAAVRSIAVSIRTELMKHPWAPDLWLRQPPGPHRTRAMEDLLRLLDDSDLTPDMAHHGFHAVNNHVLGYTVQELGMTAAIENLALDAEEFRDSLPADEFPHMIAHIDQHMAGDTAPSFELVLDLILDGITRLSAETAEAAGS